jgi:hypothetical protein
MTQTKDTTAKKETKGQDLHPEATPAQEELRELQAVEKPSVGALVPGEVTGEVGSSDIKLPTLRIMQKMSDNPQNISLGTVTVNGDTVVEGDGETTATIISIQKKYEEILPFGAGIPKRFEKLEEAIKDGFKLCRSKQDRDSGVPLVEETAIVLLVCHQPEGAMDRSFPFELAETRGVPAIWFLRSYAYGNIAKTIFSKLAFDLRGTNLLESRWKITTEKRTNSFGEFYVPHISLLPETNTPEFVTAAKEQVSFA